MTHHFAPALRTHTAVSPRSSRRRSSSWPPWPSAHAEPKFFSDDPISPRARDAGCVRRAAVGHRSLLRPDLQPVRDAAARAGEHSRAEREHDRRGARFELVHQPHRHARADRRRGRRAGPSPARRRPRRVDDHPREERRRRAGVHRAGRQRAHVVRVLRPALQPGRSDGRRGGRHEDLLGARLQPGRVLPDATLAAKRR